MKKIRILVADDHNIVRIGLKTLLNAQRDFEVVGDAENGEDAVRLHDRLLPDVVIMDLMMTGIDGVQATRRIRESRPDAKVLILTSYTTSADLSRALAFGAAGAQLKGASTDSLLKAIRSVAAGQAAVAPEIEKLVRAHERQPELTERQAQVLQAVVDGLTTDSIAARKGISVSAVKQQMALICNKHGASTRSEAVAIALRKHLLKI